MGSIALLCAAAAAFLPQQPKAKLGLPRQPPPEVVLAEGADPVPLPAYGLGDGGLVAGRGPGALQWTEDGCVTPGGVQVACRAVGVKLTFPSGRELLVGADGALHLRTGEAAGPFPSGLELRLGDGSAVRVTLAQAQRIRVREVAVVADGFTWTPWRSGGPAAQSHRASPWGGVRVACCGDGGELYRAIAIGPLLTLDRLLVPADRVDATPPQRLVVLTTPLMRGLATLPRQHREPAEPVRRAVAAVAAVADQRAAIFPAGAALARAERDDLRWFLQGGYELRLDLEGQRAPRLQLFAGEAPRPMVEWTLLGDPAAFLTNPITDQPGAGRWHGNGTRVPLGALDLQAKEHLGEVALALQLLQRLRR